MADLIAGYIKHKGTGIGGGYEIREVPFLKGVGLTTSNGEFVVQGRKSKVKQWMQSNGNLKVTTDPNFDTFHVTVGKLNSTNAGKIYLEEFFKGFVPSGGAIARVVGLFKKDDWAVVFRIGAIHPKIPHRTFPTGSRVAEVISRGKDLKLATANDAVDSVGDVAEAAQTVAELFS
jgi:hypothetical protein